MKVLLDSCIWPGARDRIAAAGHEVEWVGAWGADPGDEEILARAFDNRQVVVKKTRRTPTSDNVFRDLRFKESDAQNLLLRADLMIAIQRSFGRAGLSQTEAAKKLGVTQPRLSDLYRHRIQRFSLDALVTLAARAGLAVRMTVKKAA